MFKWIGKAANNVTDGISLSKRELVKLAQSFPRSSQGWRETFSKDNLKRSLSTALPQTSQQWGGTMSQCGNFFVVGSGYLAKDYQSIESMAAAVVADLVIGVPGKNDPSIEAARYSLGAVFLTYSFWVLHNSQIASGNLGLQKALTVQAGLWAVGTLRWPLHRAGSFLKPSYPRLGSGLQKVACLMPTGLNGFSMACVRPALIITSGRGGSFRMLTAQGFGCAADIMYANLFKYVPRLFRPKFGSSVEPIYFSKMVPPPAAPSEPVSPPKVMRRSARAGSPTF